MVVYGFDNHTRTRTRTRTSTHTRTLLQVRLSMVLLEFCVWVIECCMVVYDFVMDLCVGYWLFYGCL